MSNRRNFLKRAGAGSAGLLYPFIGGREDKSLQAEIETTPSLLGKDVIIELVTTGEQFLGIGGIRIKGKPVRNGKRHMFVDITSPEGQRLRNFKIADQRMNENEIRVAMQPEVENLPTMEWMLHTVRNRQNLYDWTEPLKKAEGTTLELIMRPVTRKFGKHVLTGFSYQYQYQSKDIAIYKILDRSSWEVNGRAEGNHFWMRNGVVDSIVAFNSPDDFYSTEWYLPEIANPNIFQYHPLQTQLQGFTFTSADAGTIITWVPDVSHVRSLFEKWRGKSEIIHFHEHCNDLANSFRTAPVEVLWLEGALNYVQRANLYELVREQVHQTLHEQIGMKRERITTYGVIEEWTEPDFDYYRANGLRKLIDAGVKTVFIPNQCQNTMNTWGISNMCCNVDFKISETVGEGKLEAFCWEAQKSGVRVEMWGNTALSTLTELFSHRDGYEKGVKFLPYEGSIMEVIDRAESPWIRNPSNAIEADHYTPRFCALNLRDISIRNYWMKQWKYFYDKVGIQGIFLDSSFNMSSDKFHFRQWPEGKGWHGATMDQKDALGKYRPADEPPKMIHTMYHAHLSWVVEMQRMGYHYCAEDMGVFGINRTGPDLLDRAKSFFMWQDSYCDFDERALLQAGVADPYLVFFKGLAYRMVWKLWWNIKGNRLELGTDDPRAFQLLHVFNQVEPFMFDREILDDEKAVRYQKDDKQVVWCFSDVEVSLGKRKKIRNVLSNDQTSSSTLHARKYQVYLIS